MGVDIHVILLKLNRKENKYEKIQLYKKDNNDFYPVSCWEKRNSELFDILSEFPTGKINEKALPDDVKKEYEEWKQDGGYGFREVSLADIVLYSYNIDHKEESNIDPISQKSNPLKYFIESIIAYLELYDPFYVTRSDIRILYWFDR